MSDTVLLGDAVRPRPRVQTGAIEGFELLDWLAAGRLTLLNTRREPVGVDDWPSLPSSVRAKALADFRRVVSPGAKAAVLFLQG